MGPVLFGLPRRSPRRTTDTPYRGVSVVRLLGLDKVLRCPVRPVCPPSAAGPPAIAEIIGGKNQTKIRNYSKIGNYSSRALAAVRAWTRSEEHTSELQSHVN